MTTPKKKKGRVGRVQRVDARLLSTYFMETPRGRVTLKSRCTCSEERIVRILMKRGFWCRDHGKRRHGQVRENERPELDTRWKRSPSLASRNTHAKGGTFSASTH